MKEPYDEKTHQEIEINTYKALLLSLDNILLDLDSQEKPFRTEEERKKHIDKLKKGITYRFKEMKVSGLEHMRPLLEKVYRLNFTDKDEVYACYQELIRLHTPLPDLQYEKLVRKTRTQSALHTQVTRALHGLKHLFK